MEFLEEMDSATAVMVPTQWTIDTIAITGRTSAKTRDL
jgi:hypothetical protein